MPPGGLWESNRWFPWQLDRQLSRDQSELVLLDVRTPMEFAWFHLPGILKKEKLAQLPQGRPLVIICLRGHRSPLVAYALKKEGFNRVYNLTWGMLGWQIYKFFSPLWSAAGCA
jgi:rhodanese-related sulfurtransferase